MKHMVFTCSCITIVLFRLYSQPGVNKVPDAQMQEIYNTIKTPYKYGLVMVPADDSKKIDCPGIFRINNKWYMVYIIFDGRGYETWIAESKNLLDWRNMGRITSFSSDTTRWDWNQKAGYISLLNPTWGGSYEWLKYQNKYWMSYLGGSSKGYEAGLLSIGMSFTGKTPNIAHEWNYLDKPVLMSTGKDVSWWENITQYKSTVIPDREKITGHSFVMFYNAKGDSTTDGSATAERIGMATSDDMVHWKRFLKDPVLNHHKGITGDAYLQKINNLWVMFYFGAFWPGDRKDAFERFACSYDLIHWTDWKGEDLVKPSAFYDRMYAHKPCVVKWKGTVYHFYCAVNMKDQRGIAVATSKNLGISKIKFVTGKHKIR